LGQEHWGYEADETIVHHLMGKHDGERELVEFPYHHEPEVSAEAEVVAQQRGTEPLALALAGQALVKESHQCVLNDCCLLHTMV
jgi:hypothetical protein